MLIKQQMLACARMEQAYSYSPHISFFANLSISYEWMSVYYMVSWKASHTTGTAVKERKFRNTFKCRFAHSMPFPCLAHAVPLPCRAAKGVEFVFPI